MMISRHLASLRPAFLAVALASFASSPGHAEGCKPGDIEIGRTATHVRCKTVSWWPAPPAGSVGDQLLQNYRGFRKLYPLYNGQRVDDKRVQDFLSVVGIQDRDKNYTMKELDHAHDAVLNCRSMQDGCDSRDHNLAAADHYLNMRREALRYGDTTLREAPTRYHLLKEVAFATGQERSLQETPNPVSTPDQEVVAWGKRGVEDGLRDYERVTRVEPRSGDRLRQLQQEWATGKYSGTRPGR
jgi:hypothetical protein